MLDVVNMLLNPTLPFSCPHICLFLEENKSKLRIKFQEQQDVCVSLSSSSMGCVARSVEMAAITVNQNHDVLLHIGI